MVYNSLFEIADKYKQSIIEAVSQIIECGQQYKAEFSDLILFGSCARLNIHVGSDVDIAIVSKEPIVDRYFRGWVRSEVEELSTGVACDIVFMTDEIMKSNDRNRLRDNIKRDGIYLMKGGMLTDEYNQLLYSCV